MPFSCVTNDSNTLESDLKAVFISLHTLPTWPKIPVHVNQTSPHPGAEVNTDLLKGSTFLWRFVGSCYQENKGKQALMMLHLFWDTLYIIVTHVLHRWQKQHPSEDMKVLHHCLYMMHVL
jgi:hypothetical protein